MKQNEKWLKRPFLLDNEQRAIVERTIKQHCELKRWTLFALNCRTNHVHVVVNAPVHPDIVMGQFKSWCTRRLKEHELRGAKASSSPLRKNWWTEDGSKRYLNDSASLEGAIQYVLEGQ